MADLDELARLFIAQCRAHGHGPYVSADGRFGIRLGVATPAVPRERHHRGSGYAYTLHFDDRPFLPLMDDPNYVLRLIAATRETEARHDR